MFGSPCEIDTATGIRKKKKKPHNTHASGSKSRKPFWALSRSLADTNALDSAMRDPAVSLSATYVSANKKDAKHVILSFDGARRSNGDGAAACILWIRNKNGEFERISHGGKVLRNTTVMTAEREALRMGVEYLATLFPVDVKECTFVVENESTETKYIVDTQSMRLFGLCKDYAMCSDRAEDVPRADANRLCQKKMRGKTLSLETFHVVWSESGGSDVPRGVLCCRAPSLPQSDALCSLLGWPPPQLFGLSAAHEVLITMATDILVHQHAPALVSQTRIRSRPPLLPGEKSRVKTKNIFSLRCCRRITCIIFSRAELHDLEFTLINSVRCLEQGR